MGLRISASRTFLAPRGLRLEGLEPRTRAIHSLKQSRLGAFGGSPGTQKFLNSMVFGSPAVTSREGPPLTLLKQASTDLFFWCSFIQHIGTPFDMSELSPLAALLKAHESSLAT